MGKEEEVRSDGKWGSGVKRGILEWGRRREVARVDWDIGNWRDCRLWRRGEEGKGKE